MSIRQKNTNPLTSLQGRNKIIQLVNFNTLSSSLQKAWDHLPILHLLLYLSGPSYILSFHSRHWQLQEESKTLNPQCKNFFLLNLKVHKDQCTSSYLNILLSIKNTCFVQAHKKKIPLDTHTHLTDSMDHHEMSIWHVYFTDKSLHLKGENKFTGHLKHFSSLHEASILEKHILNLTDTPLTEDEQSLHAVVLETTS